jgi:hypothetical protein
MTCVRETSSRDAFIRQSNEELPIITLFASGIRTLRFNMRTSPRSPAHVIRGIRHQRIGIGDSLVSFVTCPMCYSDERLFAQWTLCGLEEKAGNKLGFECSNKRALFKYTLKLTSKSIGLGLWGVELVLPVHEELAEDGRRSVD